MTKKTLVIKILALIFIIVGLGLFIASVLLNLRQYIQANKALVEFEDSKEAIENDSSLQNAYEEKEENQDYEEGELLYVLKIPSIDSENPVREGVEADVLSDSLGHDPSTAYAGNQGNCVIAGHRNYSFGKYFNRLNEVEIGDEIYLETMLDEYRYEVTEIKVVEPTDTYILDNIGDKETLTLYTCTPIYIATHRLVIIATRVNN